MTITTGVRRILVQLRLLNVKLYSDVGPVKEFTPRRLMRLGELQTMKLESDAFRSILTPEMKIVEELFKKNG